MAFGVTQTDHGNHEISRDKTLLGFQIPVIDLAYELVLAEEFVGECVSTAMENGLLTNPKRGSFGGTITPKALKMLKQGGK